MSDKLFETTEPYGLEMTVPDESAALTTFACQEALLFRQLFAWRFDTANYIIEELLREIEEELTLGMLLHRMDACDHNLYIHCIHVATLAVMIGRELDYEAEELLELALGGLFHDVGKLLIPQDILLKPTQLTCEEYEFVKKHPALGSKIFAGSDLPNAVIQTILQHHEHWDGEGYPLGLQGEEICRNAQIVTVADVFDAIICDRPYHLGLPPHQAVEAMLQRSGEFFSPHIVAAFLATLTNTNAAN